VFLLSGLLPWLAFSDALMRGTAAVVGRRDVVTKMAFPFHLFPLAAVVAAHISQLVGYFAFLGVYYAISGSVAGAQVLGVLYLLACQIVLVAGLALMLSALAVYLRDLLHILPLVLQVVFYTAPIVYPLSIVPKAYHSVAMLNPYAALAEGFHGAVIGAQWPSLGTLAALALTGCGSLLLGAWMFKRLRPGFADVL
jgi:lipopolysaccharide transport system permease protein